MMSYEVSVLVGNTWYQEHVDGCGDLRSACAILLRDGLFTANAYGPVWFPPHRIKAVEMASTTRPFDYSEGINV
jgi:hypothetical protein